MLVLSRKLGESVRIGGGIRVTVVKVSGGGVRLGISAPDGMEIVREELLRALADEPTFAEARETVKAK